MIHYFDIGVIAGKTFMDILEREARRTRNHRPRGHTELVAEIPAHARRVPVLAIATERSHP